MVLSALLRVGNTVNIVSSTCTIEADFACFFIHTQMNSKKAPDVPAVAFASLIRVAKKPSKDKSQTLLSFAVGIVKRVRAWNSFDEFSECTVHRVPQLLSHRWISLTPVA